MRKLLSQLGIICITLGLIILAGGFAVRTPASQAAVAGCPNDPATQLYIKVNQYRVAHGMHPLLRDASLDAGAVAYAAKMRDMNFFAHNSPDGTTPLSRITESLGYTPFLYGENIAAGQPDAQSAYDAFLGSPAHKAQWDTAAYIWTGVGEVTGGFYGTYWVQWFVIKNQSEYTNPPTIPSSPDPCPGVSPAPSPAPSPTPINTPTPLPPATIAITKSVDKTSAQTGNTLTYTLSVKNTSTSTPATNAKVTDTVPSSVAYITNSATPSAQASYNSTTHILTWSAGTITAGSTLTLTFKATVN